MKFFQYFWCLESPYEKITARLFAFRVKLVTQKALKMRHGGK